MNFIPPQKESRPCPKRARFRVRGTDHGDPIEKIWLAAALVSHMDEFRFAEESEEGLRHACQSRLLAACGFREVMSLGKRGDALAHSRTRVIKNMQAFPHASIARPRVQ